MTWIVHVEIWLQDTATHVTAQAYCDADAAGRNVLVYGLRPDWAHK